MPDNNQGVVYSPHDYASFSLRLIIVIIDITAIVILTVLLSSFFSILRLEFNNFFILGAYFLLPICYMTTVKTSRLRTLGYRVAGVKIVNLQGSKPRFSTMLFRFLITLVGPFQLPLNILWICNDTNKQSLRDKLAGTYVVKNNAAIIGQGEIIARDYFILGFCLLFREVDRKTVEA